MLSVPVPSSVAETPLLPEGAEPDLEYAPFDEDDGPVDCDCPAACYRGHRGYRSEPGAPRVKGKGQGGVRRGCPTPSPPPHPSPLFTQDQALVQQLGVAPSQEEEEKERRPPEEPVRAPPGGGEREGPGGFPQVSTPRTART